MPGHKTHIRLLQVLRQQAKLPKCWNVPFNLTEVNAFGSCLSPRVGIVLIADVILCFRRAEDMAGASPQWTTRVHLWTQCLCCERLDTQCQKMTEKLPVWGGKSCWAQDLRTYFPTCSFHINTASQSGHFFLFPCKQAFRFSDQPKFRPSQYLPVSLSQNCASFHCLFISLHWFVFTSLAQAVACWTAQCAQGKTACCNIISSLVWSLKKKIPLRIIDFNFFPVFFFLLKRH